VATVHQLITQGFPELFGEEFRVKSSCDGANDCVACTGIATQMSYFVDMMGELSIFNVERTDGVVTFGKIFDTRERER